MTGSLIVDDGSDLVGIGSDFDLDHEMQTDTENENDRDLVLACVVPRPAKTGSVLTKHWNPDVEDGHMMFGLGTVQAQGEEVESG